MAVVTSDFLAGVLTTFRALFEREFHAAANLQAWRDLVMPFDIDGEIGTYEWLGTVPKMEDVTGKTASIRGLLEDNFSLASREYQAVIEVSRTALERDRLGLIRPRVGQLALEAARFPGEQIFDLVRANANAYDGAAFFGDTRVIGESANIDNQRAGTGTTIAQIQTDLASNIGVMRLFQDDRGRPMNLVPNLIMVPTAMEQPMWQALNRTPGDNVNTPVKPAGSNVWTASGYRVVTNPYLTDVNNWYLFYIGGPAERPFLLQMEKAPVLESDTDPNTRENILKRNFLYSVYGRWAVAMTDPRFGILITNT